MVVDAEAMEAVEAVLFVQVSYGVAATLSM